MLLALAIYLIDILHSIDNVAFVLLVAIAYGVYNIFLSICKEDEYKHREGTSRHEDLRDTNIFFRERLKKWATAFCLSVVVVWLAPDKETSYTMLAAYGLTEAYEFVSDSEEVQGIAAKSLKLIEKHIDKYIEGMDNPKQQTTAESKDTVEAT